MVRERGKGEFKHPNLGRLLTPTQTKLLENVHNAAANVAPETNIVMMNTAYNLDGEGDGNDDVPDMQYLGV